MKKYLKTYIQKLIVLSTVFTLVAGCATPKATHFRKPSDLDQFDAWKLALDYHYFMTGKANERFYVYGTFGVYEGGPILLKQIEDALLKKGIPKKDLEMAKTEKIVVGMSLEGLYASWGRPTKENKTTTTRGVNIQHVYEQYGKYVYTKNGFISAIQE